VDKYSYSRAKICLLLCTIAPERKGFDTRNNDNEKNPFQRIMRW